MKSNKPQYYSEMENMVMGKGDLGIKRNPPAQAIPKQVRGGETRTGSGKPSFDVAKKMKKIMKKVTGC